MLAKGNLKWVLCVLTFFLLVEDTFSVCEQAQPFERVLRFDKPHCQLPHCYDPEYTATRTVTYSKILCQNIYSTNQIDDGFYRNMYSPQEGIFIELKNSKLSSLTAGSLAELTTIKGLYMQEVSLEVIFPGAFSGLNYLQELLLTHNRLKILSNGVYNSLNKLQVLNLAHNQISQLEKNSLSGLIQLKECYLNDNNISHIEENFFDSLKTLEYLDISRNPLERISYSELPRLMTFLMSETAVQEFTFDLSNLTYLEKLNLSYNELSEVDCNNFPQLDYLDLAGNNLDNVTDLDILLVNKLNLAKNNLKYIRIPPNRNLTALDYSFNKISQIAKDIFRRFDNLTELSLGGNQIKFLPLTTFQDLHNLTFLNLSYNLIEEFQFGTFEGLNKLMILDVSGNKLSTLQSSVFSSLYLREFYFSWNQIKFFDFDSFLRHHLKIRILSFGGNSWNCRDLVDIYHKCIDHVIEVPQGNSYEGENFRGMSCDNSKPQQKSNLSLDEASFDALTAQFLSSLNKQVDQSELKKFFQEDFKSSNFFRYFDEGYKKSQFFTFLADYKLSVHVKDDNFNGSQTGKFTALEIKPVENQNGNSVLIFIVIILVIIACLNFAVFYLIFSFIRNSKINSKNETLSTLELC